MVAVYSRMISSEAYVPQTIIADPLGKDLIRDSLIELGADLLSDNIKKFVSAYKQMVGTGMRAQIAIAGQTLEKQISALEKKDFVERSHEMCVGVWCAARIIGSSDLEDRALELMVPKLN